MSSIANLFGGAPKMPKLPVTPRMPVPKTAADLQKMAITKEGMDQNRLGRAQTVLGTPQPSGM